MKRKYRRHFTTVHKGFQLEISIGSELRKKTHSNRKLKLHSQHSSFRKPVQKNITQQGTF